MILNQSRLQVFMDCPRKYYWQYVKNYVAPRPQINLEVGSAVHDGLAVLESELHKGVPLSTATERMLQAAEARFRAVVPPPFTPDEETFYTGHLSTIRNLLTGYVAEYGGKTPWTALGLEVAGTVPIGDGRHSLRFRTDQIAVWNRGLWIVDHKTAAKLDMRDIQKYHMDIQITAYGYGAGKILGKSVQGVIIDMLVKTKIPQYHYDVFTRTDEDYREFELEFNTWADKIQEYTDRVADAAPDSLEDRTAFPKNTKECFRYGTCPFHALCASHGRTVDAYERRKPDYVDDEALLAPRATSDPTPAGPGPEAGTGN